MINYLVCFWVLFKLSKNKVASIIGAFIFSLALPVYDQMIHTQTIARCFVPLAFYSIIRFFQTQQHKYFLYILLSVIGQFYFSIYLGLLLSLGLLPFGILYGCFYFREINFKKLVQKNNVMFYLIYSLIASCLLFVLMKPYYERRLTTKPFDYAIAFDTVPHISSYFLFPETLWFGNLFLLKRD